MADGNKKRNNSFRRLFPFFSKSKEKNSNKKTHVKLHKQNEVNFSNNQYHDPRAITSIDKRYRDNDERIYENLTIHVAPDNDIQSSGVLSEHSSSSTLVSESVKNRTFSSNDDSEIVPYRQDRTLSAGPQVPLKPFDESPNKKTNASSIPQYPDVYYHSIEKLSDPGVSVARSSQDSPVIVNPTPVRAEIKKVSTKFLISPKKEAEVRTIQPTRARSLSFTNNSVPTKENHTQKCSEKRNPTKTYNYSAPTSPIPVNNKVPNMPKTVSPYGHVRKNMNESEEKSNSLGRASVTTPTRTSLSRQIKTSTPVTKLDAVTLEKEKTRQRVEAFYWQKLKEMKEKEDEYYLQQALNSANTTSPKVRQGGSACSSPSSLLVEPKSYSLPRGTDFQSYSVNGPQYPGRAFIRGAPERRTDTFIVKRTTHLDPNIIYRNPEKLNLGVPPEAAYSRSQKPNTETKNLQPKRVNFEEQLAQTGGGKKVLTSTSGKESNQGVAASLYGSKGLLKCPPRPPVRTTSVGNSGRAVNNKLPSGQFVYSESESGSEAGEIQRIMQSNRQCARDDPPSPRASAWPCVSDDDHPEISDLYESDVEQALKSVVSQVQTNFNPETQNSDDVPKPAEPDPQPQLSPDFINILGDSKIKEIPFGPKIPEEVSKRWGGILIDGLNRDHKKELLATTLIPENFQLLKAPILNQEISAVLTESARNRDKRLERNQNHLGIGIAGITSLMSSLMEGKEIDQIEMVKTLSQVGQILLDLHYENTVNRKMLILPSLDKKFLSIIQDVKRDTYLYGNNFGEKIKATKAAEKSGLQIRNTHNIGPQPSASRKNTVQGNWRGPPRQQGQRAVKPGGHKQRYMNPPPRRPTQTPFMDRSQGPTSTKPSYRATRK